MGSSCPSALGLWTLSSHRQMRCLVCRPLRRAKIAIARKLGYRVSSTAPQELELPNNHRRAGSGSLSVGTLQSQLNSPQAGFCKHYIASDNSIPDSREWIDQMAEWVAPLMVRVMLARLPFYYDGLLYFFLGPLRNRSPFATRITPRFGGQ
jgi:hypothetical protein